MSVEIGPCVQSLGSHLTFVLVVVLDRVVIWMGDLNYRISDLTVDAVKVLIDSKDLKTLIENDQVRLPCYLAFPPCYIVFTWSLVWLSTTYGCIDIAHLE